MTVSTIICPTDTLSKNWFQNRRAKAKQQSLPRSDASGGEESFPYSGNERHPPDHIGMVETSNPSFSFASDQGVLLDGGFVSDVPTNRSDDFQSHYSGQFPSVNTVTDCPTHDISQDVPLNTFWSVSAPLIDSTAKAPTISAVELVTSDTISESPSMHPYGLDVLHGSTYHGQPLYQTAIDGQMIGNPSSHSFVTSPSEEGEHTKFITPPQETSPLPGENQAIPQHDRRTSNSSDLAENFDTIHLQQPQVGLGLHESPEAAPIVIPNSFSPGGLPTPEISPDTVTNNPPFPNGHDLASRRKRPRPPTLKSESNRSVSYAGPSTVSPHLRVTPPGSAKMSPVRRIRSTGYNLNVMNGRVKKPGTASAQMSPRHVESFLKTSCTELQSSTGKNVTPDVRNDAGIEILPSQNSPKIPAHESQLLWSDDPLRQTSVAPPFEYGFSQDATYPYTQIPTNHWGPPQDSHGSSMETPMYRAFSQSSQYGFHCPPQSAPSHITTFSQSSSSLPSHAQQGWAMPFVNPTQHYRDDVQVPMAPRPNRPHHHSHSGPLGQFLNNNSNFGSYSPSIEPYQSNEHPFHRTPSADHKSIEFKIDTGPPPPKELAQALQETKEYTFNNQFSNNFPATHGKK